MVMWSHLERVVPDDSSDLRHTLPTILNCERCKTILLLLTLNCQLWLIMVMFYQHGGLRLDADTCSQSHSNSVV